MKIFPLTFSVVNVQVWKESGSNVSDQKIMDWFKKAQAYFLKVRVNLELRGITTFTNAALRDLDKKVPVPPYMLGDPYQFTSDETTLLMMRAAEPRDLNVYVVRRFLNVDTQATLTNPLAYTLTADLFNNVVDSANSGIAISAEALKLPTNRGAEGVVLAHEIGHALLYQGSWPQPNEHLTPTGSLYASPFLMSQSAHPTNTRFDAAQGNNISTNGPFIIFRSDP